MIGKEVLGEKFVPLPLVKKILKKIPADDMTYEQKIALEHAEKFSKLSAKEAETMIGELKELGLRVRDDVITKIVDILPGDEAGVKAVLLQSGTQLKKDQLQKILDIVSKHKA